MEKLSKARSTVVDPPSFRVDESPIVYFKCAREPFFCLFGLVFTSLTVSGCALRVLFQWKNVRLKEEICSSASGAIKKHMSLTVSSKSHLEKNSEWSWPDSAHCELCKWNLRGTGSVFGREISLSPSHTGLPVH